MKVSLIDYTGIGLGPWHAAEIMILTKSTRLNMQAGLLEAIRSMPIEDKLKELEYMSNTIPSSWEFSNYTFLIEGVTRAFTHQFVRTRQGSYAQQTMRVLNVDGFDYESGPTIDGSQEASDIYDTFMYDCNQTYNKLIEMGVAIEDARGVLPTNICTNIVAKFNLRTLSEMASKRSSPRTQGEYRNVLIKMIDAVIEAHPWAHVFLRNRNIDAAAKLDEHIKYMKSIHAIDDERHTELLKLVDILRG